MLPREEDSKVVHCLPPVWQAAAVDGVDAVLLVSSSVVALSADVAVAVVAVKRLLLLSLMLS